MTSGLETTAPRRRLPKPARRVKLLAAAEQVFAEVGYRGATMELIAARGGVTRPLLYEHFSSLDEIYVECVRAARAELDARFLEVSLLHRDSSLHELLRAAIVAYFGFVRDRGTRWDVLFGGGPAPTGEIGRLTTEMRFRTVDQLAGLAQLAAPQLDRGRALTYAHAVSGAGEQLARWWRRTPDVTLDEVVERLMEVVWQGLQAVLDEPVA